MLSGGEGHMEFCDGYWWTQDCKIDIRGLYFFRVINTTTNYTKLFITPLTSIRKVLVIKEFPSETPGAILFLSYGIQGDKFSCL